MKEGERGRDVVLPTQAHWKKLPVAAFLQNDITLHLAPHILQDFRSERSSEWH